MVEAWERRSMDRVEVQDGGLGEEEHGLDRVEVHDGGLGEEAEREVSVFF